MREGNHLTKEYIKTAMLELLAQRNFAKISITDLVARAGVSRTAFYRNYASKEDLMEEIVNDVLNIFSIESIKNMLHYSKDEYAHFFSLLRSKKKEISLITSAGIENINIINRNSNVSNAIINHHQYLSFEEIAFMGAFNSITFKWTLNGMKESDQEMAETVYKVLYNERVIN